MHNMTSYLLKAFKHRKKCNLVVMIKKQYPQLFISFRRHHRILKQRTAGSSLMNDKLRSV